MLTFFNSNPALTLSHRIIMVLNDKDGPIHSTVEMDDVSPMSSNII